MLFKETHVPMILNGTKTATRRVWKRPMVKVGGIYKAKLQMLSKDYFAKIKITKLYQQHLWEIKKEDVLKEGYKTLKGFREIWIKINGVWDSDSKVDVIEFELIKEKSAKVLK